MNKEDLKKMYVKGYRYCIVFSEESNIKPLTVKNLSDIGPMIRENFPNEKNWRGFEFDENGNEINPPPEYEIKITGSGTKDQLVSALQRVIVSIKETSDPSGMEWECPILMTEID